MLAGEPLITPLRIHQEMTVSIPTPLRAALLFGAIAALPAPAAHASDWSLGLRAGTLGLGIEGTWRYSPNLAVRVPLNLLDYSFDRSEDGVDYDAKLQLQSFGALIDYYPFGGTFFLSGGLMDGGNKVKLKASDPTGTEEYDIGDQTYTSDPSDPLTVRAGVDFGGLAPYAGIGWGNSADSEAGWFGRFEIGALFQGAGDVSASSSGSAIAENGDAFDTQGDSLQAQVFQANLEEERQELEEDIGDFKIYPAIGLAFGMRF